MDTPDNLDDIARVAITIKKLKRKLAGQGITMSEPPRDVHGRMPKDAVIDETTEFRRLVDAGMKSWRIAPVHRQTLDIAFGRSSVSRRLLLSNARIRERAANSLIDTVSALWRDRARRFFFVTIFDDRGNALEYAPAVHLAALRQRLHAALVETGLHGFGTVELQGVTNMPQAGLGRSLIFHGHAIAWTNDSTFDAETIADRVSASGLLRNFLGARTVVITEIARSHRQLIWDAYYLLKAPTAGKMIARSQPSPSGWNFNAVNLRPDLAVRIMEALSQLEYTDMLFAAGEGVDVQHAWLSDLQRWHRQQRSAFAAFTDEGDVAAVWAALWSRRQRVIRNGFNFREEPDDEFTSWEIAAHSWLAARPATRRYSLRKRPTA